MSNLSLREIAQSQLDSTPVIDGQLIVCLDTGNAYRDTATAHVKIGSDLEVVSDLPLAPLAEKLYYLKPDKLYVFLGGNWTLLNDKTIDLDEAIAKLPAGDSTSLNDDVEIITQDTDITQSHYYRRKLVVLWEYIKTKAQDFFAAKNHQHGKADITDFPISMPASDVYPWAKAATKPSYTKAEVGLGKVDNTADADKTVKRATTAGTADSANSVAWGNVRDKPTTFPVEAHNHDDRYYTEAEMDGKLSGKSNIGHTHDDRYYTESEVETKLSGKADINHIHLNGIVGGDVDWNTFITYGVYKIQNCTMSDTYHAPNPEYQFGILQVVDSENNVGEKRILQIYWPHCTPNGNHFWYRMHNSSDINAGWSGWVPIKNKPDASGISDVTNALSGFTPRSSQNWGVQTGTFVHGEGDSTGGDFAFRRDCPNAGQVSMVLDGRFYQNDGQYRVLDEGDISGIRTRSDIDLGVPLAKASDTNTAPWAGAADNPTFEQCRSMIGTKIDGSGTWWTVLSIRHRNGAGDGPSYGLLLFSQLTNTGDTLWYRKQSGNWTENRNILDSTNYGSYALPLSGGTLTGALHIKQPNSGNYNENIRMHPSSGNWTAIVMCGDDNTGDSGTSAKTWGIFTYNGEISIAKNGTSLNGSSSNASLTCKSDNVWRANDVPIFTTAGGTISGAVTANTYYAPNWFRATGDSGFYFENHGGGWYMIDDTWIRAYNNKNIYTPGVIQCDSGFNGNLNGNATTSTLVRHQGNVTAISGTSTRTAGLQLYGAYNNGYPMTFGNVICASNGAFGSEIALDCVGGDGKRGPGRMYYRNRSDWGTSEWSDWATVAYLTDKVAGANHADSADSATNASYLNFTAGNEINFNGTPSNNTVYVGYRNTSINEYKFNNGNSGGGLAQVTASQFNGSLNGTATNAEYLGNDAAYMRMHWNGQGGQPTWLWGGNDASNMYVWNPSNFSVNYANSAGSVAWGNVSGKPSTFTPSSHTHSSINSVGTKNAQTGRNQTYGDVYSYNSNASANTGMPTTYTSTIGFGQGAAGTVEICGEWTGGKGLWSRALRDYQDSWYNWQRIYTENYHPSADSAGNGVTASGYNYVRFGDGTQMCWGQQDIADTGTTITFAVAFSSIPAVVNSGTEDIDDVFFVHNITTTNFVADKKGWYSGNNTWIAIGRWK